MDQYRQFSELVYDVEAGNIKVGKTIVKDNYLVLDTVNTNKDTIGNETTPKGNRMQAIVVDWKLYNEPL